MLKISNVSDGIYNQTRIQSQICNLDKDPHTNYQSTLVHKIRRTRLSCHKYQYSKDCNLDYNPLHKIQVDTLGYIEVHNILLRSWLQDRSQ